MRPLRFAGPLLVLAAFGCSPSIHDAGGTPTPTGTQTPTPTPTPNPGDHVTADTTWSGAKTIATPTTIDAGVTLTVDSSAHVSIAPGAAIWVQGTLLVNGNMSTPVVFDSSSPGNHWAGLEIQAGGTATIKWATITDAQTGLKIDTGALPSKFLGLTFDGVTTTPMNIASDASFCRANFANGAGESYFSAGTISFDDSRFVGGNQLDITSVSGSASLTFDQSEFATNWHCIMHGSTTASWTVTNSKLHDAHWAFMWGNVPSATVKNNQIVMQEGGDYGILSSGGSQTVDAQDNYWGPLHTASCPTLSGWNTANCTTSSNDALVVNAGPRAMGTGCETTF